MKKSTIWIIACVMGVSLLTLLYLQFRYFENVYNMRKEQFGESVTRSLSQAAQNLELYETQKRLDKELEAREDISEGTDTQIDSIRNILQTNIASQTVLVEEGTNAPNHQISEALRDTIKRFFHRKELMDEMLTILYKPSGKALAQRLDFKELDSNLQQELRRNGINIPYHLRVTTSDGSEVFRCSDYENIGEEETYRQELYPNDPRPKLGILYVHFPDMQQYILSSVRFMIPAIVFTLIVIVIFAFTIYTIFRQKRLTEIKNDFINNMTHEFKTPISTISLAAQMLSDPTITKSERMFKHVCGIINDETKRLRFQVEKVLQMSMFDKKAATFKKKEIDVNELISDVVTTFRLKVESSGGTLQADLQAKKTSIFVDEMHFTNVIFNLMDNAVKNKNPETDLHLLVTTENKDDKVVVTIADNGIGIKKEDIKKIFEKFYRVHTGNRHDVKGFGLGLAYVKNVITNLDGSIYAESDYGIGTKFIITLPTI